ncbi:hypothetical protein [Aeromicrobium sp.]|uniref:hypothetical protein n=1 Tax=Aeromicrobium sp. TaxID=1871063 RepID=UPI0030C266EC
MTAPLVVEAMERAIDGVGKVGVLTAGEAFDARDFLESLSPEHLSISFDAGESAHLRKQSVVEQGS